MVGWVRELEIAAEENIQLLGAETEALLELHQGGPWEVWTEGKESRIADLVLRNLCARGFASMERVNSTCHSFTISPAGRQWLAART